MMNILRDKPLSYWIEYASTRGIRLSFQVDNDEMLVIDPSKEDEDEAYLGTAYGPKESIYDALNLLGHTARPV